MIRHHPVFDRFECWDGDSDPGFSPTFIGAQVRTTYENLPGRPPAARPDRIRIRTSRPAFDEEYFEWIDLLEAVSLAQREFVMIELGAGYGRWLANAAVAIRRTSGLPYRLIAVEAEPTHFRWIREHFRNNDIDLSRCDLIRAAAATEDGHVYFHVGKPSEWYGQAIAEGHRPESLTKRIVARLRNWRQRFERPTIEKVPAVSLTSILKPLRHVDLIDADIQGAEFDVFASARELLDEKVSRVHIGTHSAEVERGLRELFHGAGWQCLHDFACGKEQETPYGRIRFGDGVQSWVNPRRAKALRAVA